MQTFKSWTRSYYGLIQTLVQNFPYQWTVIHKTPAYLTPGFIPVSPDSELRIITKRDMAPRSLIQVFLHR